jgi:hypothetical protein
MQNEGSAAGEVLLVYREVMLQNQVAAQPGGVGAPRVITVSIDEKPGVQAIENTAPDLPPVPGHSFSQFRHTGKL